MLRCKLPSLSTFLTWVGFEIGINKSLVISVDCSCHARPWLGNAERTGHVIALYYLSLQVQAQEGWSGEQNRNSKGFCVIDLARVTLLLTAECQWRATGGENESTHGATTHCLCHAFLTPWGQQHSRLRPKEKWVLWFSGGQYQQRWQHRYAEQPEDAWDGAIWEAIFPPS